MVFAISWASAIYYWRSAGVSPDGRDLLTYLGVLPAGLAGIGWLLAYQFQRLLAARKAPAAKDAEAGAPAPTGQVQADVGAGQDAVAVLLAGAINLPVGQDPAEVLARRGDLQRPGLHPRFRDQDGLPLFAASVAGLETDPAMEAFPGYDGMPATEAQRRAMALLAPVLEELLLRAWQELPMAPATEERIVAGLRRVAESRPSGLLHVHLLLAADWDPSARRMAEEWTTAQALAIGLPAAAVSVQAIPAEDAISAWEHLSQAMQAMNTSTREVPQWHLLLAAASLLDEAKIDRLLAGGELMTRRRPDGFQPGEGAAGVLLRAPDAAEADATLLHLPLRRAAAANASARALARQSGELLADSLDRAGVNAADVGWVVSDADHRPDGAAETASAAMAACPDLDTSSQFLAFGAVCGHLPPVEPLAMLALALAHAADAGNAVAILSAADRKSRLCAVVSPSRLSSHDADDGRQPVAAPSETGIEL